ncbi:uracil-DNA glycosylase [Floricoccus penangensis]|uniref:Uracil-DNA glycosylase n=1 Tax=Floricoccus penangensis TaxID=1859475 RepID=A0A9Q5NYK8_9LACT|nr:uracil-DNA glycosylase [Floricoccus penangensis]OFI45721.1 uracil-DNA glycosylase [Floricoccus penangensis]
MDYPEKLVKQILADTKDMPLEGFLSGQGSIEPKVMFVGEAPGRTEIETHIPFSGQAGKWLDEWLESINLKRDDIYITSVVRSRPFHTRKKLNKKTGEFAFSHPNRTPTKKEILIHAPLIDFEIESINPKILAPMGNSALQRLLGNQYKISDWHGKIFDSKIQVLNDEANGYQLSQETYKIFPLYHPAAILYNGKLKKEIEDDWQKLKNNL